MSAWRYCMFVVAASTGACIFPPDLHVEPLDTRYTGTCRCVVCTEVDPNTLQCVNTVNKDSPLFLCSTEASRADENAMADELRQECMLSNDLNSQCDLIEIDSGTVCPSNKCSPYVAQQDGDHNCATSTSSRVAAPAGPKTWSLGRVASGTIQISSPQGSGTASLSGSIEFIGANCSTGTCPFQIVDISLEGVPFSIGGTTVSHPYVINTTLGDGFLLADASVFMIPAQTLQILASGDANGDRQGILATSDVAGVGIINQHARQLVFAQSFSVGSTTVDISLSASIDNLLPTVSLPSSPVFECNAPGGSNITLAATAGDTDGHIANAQWYVDGTLAPVNTTTLSTFVPLGTHSVRVDVFDNDGGQATSTATILVQDTTAPSLSFDQFCIWPPDHELYAVDSSAVHVSDACDPNVTVQFVSGTSSQADNGTGDGNTTGDLVVNPSAVCVRAERDGNVLYGRTYSITATATDSNSNTSDFTFDIVVPHDLSPRCTTGGEATDSSDPRCIPPPDDPSTTAGTEPQKPSGGCDSGRGGSSWLLMLLVLGVMKRKRRA